MLKFAARARGFFMSLSFRRYVAFLLLLAPVCGEVQGANIWLSTSANVSSSGAAQTPPESESLLPVVNHSPSSKGGSLFIWARPDSTLTLNRWSLRVLAERPDVLKLIGADIASYNPLLTTSDGASTLYRRWDGVGEAEAEEGTLEDEGPLYSILDEVNGFIERTAKGIGPQSVGGTALWKDPLHRTPDAWLLGRIDYELTGVSGTSDIWLQLGVSGISHIGGGLEQTNVVLGASSDDPLNGLHGRARFSETREARVNVGSHPPVTSADFDYDGDVDGSDFLTWQRNFGRAPKALRVHGDADENGTVHQADLTIWKQQVGIRPVVTMVPEPTGTCISLIAVGSLAVGCVRRHKTEKGQREPVNKRVQPGPARIIGMRVLVLIAAACSMLPQANAADLYWDGISAAWDNAANWSTNTQNPTPNPADYPKTGDIAFFNVATRTNDVAISLGGNQRVDGLRFINLGSVTIQGGSTLTIEQQGIVKNPHASGSGPATITSPLHMRNTQTWANNSSGRLYINGIVTAQDAGRTLTINGTNSIEINGQLNLGNGGLDKGSDGNASTLILNHASNNYAGNTTIYNGKIRVKGAGSLGSGTLVFGQGTAVVLDGQFDFGRPVWLSGAGALEMNGWNATLGAAGANGINGPGSLSLVGGGTLTLVGPNGYSGGTAIGAGTLVVNPGSSVGTGQLHFNGGSLRTSGSLTVFQPVVMNSPGAIDTAGQVSHFAGGLAGGGSLTINGGGRLDLTGGSSATGETFLNFSTLGASSGNLPSGALRINGGWLQASSSTNYGHTFVLGASGAAIDSNGHNVTISGQIQGTGGINKVSGATLTLTSDNVYTGTTTVSAGTLQVGSGGGTGSLSNLSNIINNSDLVFNRGNDYVYSGGISGSGTVAKIGAGMVTLSGNNSYSGDTTIGGGVLSGGTIANNGNDSAFGRGNFSMSNGGTLQYTGGTASTNRAMALGAGGGGISVTGGSTTLTMNGVISGAGSLTKTGAGTLHLTSTNTAGFTGNYHLRGGTLAIGAGLSFGESGGGIIMEGGALNLGQSVATSRPITLIGQSSIISEGLQAKLNGVISGGGSLHKNGAGDLYLTANNTYFGGTTLNGGRLFAENGSLGSGPVTINGGMLLTGAAQAPFETVTINTPVVLNAATSSIDTFSNGAVINGVVSGPGKLHKTGWGTLVLTNENNSYSGGTAISLHYLQGNAKSIRGPIEFVPGNPLNGKGVIFNQTEQGVFSSNITGDGSLTKTGAGTLELWGYNYYSRGTSIEQGVLLGDRVSFGTGPITVNSGAAIHFRENGSSGEFAPIISGAGALIKDGVSTLTLSGTHAYTGGTTINGGKLLVNGSVAGPVIVNSGGILGGSGTINGNVSGPGRLAPGNSPGIITINGNYTQNPNGTLEIEVGGLTAVPPTPLHDKVIVNGTASLAGAYEFPITPGFTPMLNDEIIFLTANSIVGAPDPTKITAPNLQNIAPGLGITVFKNANDLRLRFVAPTALTFVDNTGDPDASSWHQTANWTDGVNNRVPISSDVVNLTRSQTGNVQQVDVTAGDAIAHSIAVSDPTSPIAIGVTAGKTLRAATGDITIGNHATIELVGGVLATPQNLNVLNGGQLIGDGAVQGDVFLGQVSGGAATLGPGVAVGDLSISGDYKQAATGKLVIDVDGDTDSDLLQISGDADLGGTVRFNVVDPNISLGVEYPFLAAGTLALNEKFNNIEISGSSDLYFNVSYQYGAAVPASTVSGVAALTAAAGASYSAYLIGDMNLDGSYNANDAEDLAKFFVSRRRWINEKRLANKNPDDRSANIDGKFDSNFDDLQAFLDDFPQAAEAYYAAYDYYLNAIPEPSGAVLAAAAMTGLVVNRRRKVVA